MSDPVEAYFTALRDIRASGAGVAETSYYGPLAALLDEVGKHLKPKVRAIINLRNTGAGIPDGGLFTAPQLKGWEPGTDPLAGQLPARGAIEVKGTADDVLAVAESEQVARYIERYGLVLVTNLRDFVLVGRDAAGSGVRTLESCRLSLSEATFWAKCQTPRTFAGEAGEGLTEFLRRVLLHEAPLMDPKDVAWFLASYARTARLRLEQKHEMPALDALRSQLEDSLGLKFEGEKGDHFFRSTLVQTLFYGMFASWVLWARDRDHTETIPWDRRFQWETATATLHVPMVYELFRQFADVRQLGALGISEVLEWAEEVLWRVDRAAFFERFREEHAVQYFYEPFLEAFDPQLRKELGVWYTPDEVVKYMVARVDTVLREELDIADGLADPSVVVLDPCCGTGAYLVEVLRKIDETLQAKGADALTRQDVKRAAMQRVIGFEIMPAPYVVAHLQLGILLAELGIPLRDADERAAVYLTNALTGWQQVDAPKAPKVGAQPMHSTLLFPEFAHERDEANRIKREEQILVVIGNPPYNGFAGVAQDEEADLLQPFKERRGHWDVKKNKLDDLYVRFFALALRRIGLMSGRGVVAFISNDSWLSGPSYVTVRERLADSFDVFWIEGMHGDRSMSEYGPDGRTSQTVFAVPGFSPGIRQGVAISTWVKRGGPNGDTAQVLYRSDLNESDAVARRRALLETLGQTDFDSAYSRLSPSNDNNLSFKPFEVDACYLGWPDLAELSRVTPMLGLNENRGETLIDEDRELLARRIEAYFSKDADLSDLPAELGGLKRDWARFDAAAARRRLLQSTGFSEERIRRFQSKPLDWKWAYVDSSRPLWNEPRPDLQAQLRAGAEFVLARVRAPKERDGAALGFATGAIDQHALHKDAYAIPVTLATSLDDASLFNDGGDGGSQPNLSARALGYTRGLGIDDDLLGSRLVWMHVLATCYAPAYLQDNAHGIAAGWPRVPLPSSSADLSASARLGAAIAQLLDSDAVCPEQGTGALGSLTAILGTALSESDLGLTAQWGLRQREGVITPSKGRLTERPYAVDERVAIAGRAASLGMSPEQATTLLGETCFDVYLNDVAYWRCVPSNVWRYTIGGYQVIKKWLSYRERALFGRDLKPEEARYVTEMVRRIAALVLMQPELDANYEHVKADVWEWGA